MVNPNRVTQAIFLLCLLSSFVIAWAPEPPATLLTPLNGWVVRGDLNGKVSAFAFPEQYRQLRQSIVESNAAEIFRSWAPGRGKLPIEVASPPFRPGRFLSIPITGATHSLDGGVQAHIECELNRQRVDVFKGSVNVNVAEALVAIPAGWCPGNARLQFTSNGKSYTGIGPVFEVSALSYLKSTFVGRLPFLITALGVFSLVIISWTALAVRLSSCSDAVPVSLTVFGAISLATFYLFSVGVTIFGDSSGLCIVIIFAASLLALFVAGHDARFRAARSLAPYARMWAVGSCIYFAILGMANNGLGHWEPNYRFWPAAWSSDNELPWFFAEAIRNGWELRELFGGGWLPTDRPPLMTGAYLLLSDLFRIIQIGNDGIYLRGQAYNAAAIALNALWIPAGWWLLGILNPTLTWRRRMAILVFVGCAPFVLFNSIYGWPKVFGAAFALVAFGTACRCHEEQEAVQSSTILLFFLLSGFSMLAHASTALFLAPLLTLFFWRFFRPHPMSVLAATLGALALLASWAMYKQLVLPSENPLPKYALTGDYGFHRGDSLWTMIAARYVHLDLLQWLEIKKTMLLQVFAPVHHSIARIDLNSDFGAGPIDSLRAWDFVLLSKGSMAVPCLVAISYFCRMRNIVSVRGEGKKDRFPFCFELMTTSVIAWLLFVLIFFAPAVIHHLPQAALLGLALGGAVVVQERLPRVFQASFLATMGYTIIVWVLSPLRHALSIDIGAVLAFVALLYYVRMPALLLSFPKMARATP